MLKCPHIQKPVSWILLKACIALFFNTKLQTLGVAWHTFPPLNVCFINCLQFTSLISCCLFPLSFASSSVHPFHLFPLYLVRRVFWLSQSIPLTCCLVSLLTYLNWCNLDAYQVHYTKVTRKPSHSWCLGGFFNTTRMMR